ncbi:unnamed protein product [Porites lobata]|uniref:Regulatory protein zeste n=1 Tax=Porites lobata TaxID=104759 RepID=A0ABN8Q6R9_9CNID|nr:unnamed protein product [Porites lobata]
MEWTDDHDILLLREMIATEFFFQCKKGSPDRGKIWESIQERLNKLDNPKFMIKEKRGVRDRWNLLQAKFKRTQREELQASGIDCELSEKDTLIEELCEREDSFSAKDKKKSDDKEAAEEIRKKAMERMKRKSTESAYGSAKKSRRSGGDAVEFLKEKAQSEYSIRQQELELQRKEQEVRARQQELQIELLRKQTEQQVQISQALMTMMQNMVKK